MSLYIKCLYHFLRETCFCIPEWYTLISLYLMEYKYVKIRFEHGQLSCTLVAEVLVVYGWISIRWMLYQVWITYINFKTSEEYMQELDSAETDRQTECINIFKLYWKCEKENFKSFPSSILFKDRFHLLNKTFDNF